MTTYPKRLIEVDLPIARISAHSRREKSIRHGHISTLHIWWARRPLAACRAVICAALWPDPVSLAEWDARGEEVRVGSLSIRPQRFLAEAREQMGQRVHTHFGKASADSLPRLFAAQKDPSRLDDPLELRGMLLDFIADFADWDNSTDPDYLAAAQQLTEAAHEALGGERGTRPLVVDPFSGGGSIPLEALRVGADAFASDLNPVAVLLNKAILEYVPRYGARLAEEVRAWGEWMTEKAKSRLEQYYPAGPEGERPMAHIWARTIRCEGPNCGARVPLIRSCDLDRGTGTGFRVGASADGVKIEILSPGRGVPTIGAGSATCPVCGHVNSARIVRAQLAAKRGGSADAQHICSVLNTAAGRKYDAADSLDEQVVLELSERLAGKAKGDLAGCEAFMPEASISSRRPAANTRGVSAVTAIGIANFRDLFSPRQLVCMATLVELLSHVHSEVLTSSNGDADLATAVTTLLAMAVDRTADYNSSLCTWVSAGGFIGHAFTKQALSNVWDFAEVYPFSGASGSFQGAIKWVAKVVEANALAFPGSATTSMADARRIPLPHDAASAFVTDPPYYAEIPYADISDFFYVWLRMGLGALYPDLFQPTQVDRRDELIVTSSCENVKKDADYFEAGFADFAESARMVTQPGGIGVIVFANAKTSAWEAMLEAVNRGGLRIVSSWPIDTERPSRTRARNAASLQSSIHLVCRPRENPDGTLLEDVGEWRDVLGELPGRIHDWMPSLASKGVVGADAIFSCLGPALEIFSRFSRVDKSSGETVSLGEYLEHVWAVVSKEALSLVFDDPDTAGLEPDARLTAMWLWTLGASTASVTAAGSDDAKPEDGVREQPIKPSGKTSGYTLDFDAARKIAQGLGIHLDKASSIVEIKGDKARLLPVPERTRHLFGKDAVTGDSAKEFKNVAQMDLFAELQEVDAGVPGSAPELAAPEAGRTVLDRVHQAMILFGSGQGEALKRFLVEDGIAKQADVWTLAQALSALYPTGSDEKRWVDGVLARKKGLGL